jgi:hypothetical protein
MAALSRSTVKQVDNVDLEMQRRRSLSELLRNPKKPAGRAFKKLCDAGCNSQWLEYTLLGLKNYPFGHAQIYTNQHTKQFEAVIRDLEAAAGRLKQIPDLPIFAVFFADWPSLVNWPTAPEDDHVGASLGELSGLLRTIIKRLRKIVDSPNLRRFRVETASHRLPRFIEQIRKRTGKAHYADTATLVSAAYDRHTSREHLKVIARPRRRVK